ncbi:MAG TPA: Hpt domain-containing protein [Bryobacteraceae bacterium]|nr:Hpt domain-containing protein [Bryobacteraceae bacterium]
MSIKVEPEIISGFVQEVESYLPKLVQSLEDFRANPLNMDSLEEAHRMVHCIRGAGSTIGLYALSQLAQYQEDALEQLLSGQLTWTEEVSSFLEFATIQIGQCLHRVTTGEVTEPGIVTDLGKAFGRLRSLAEAEDAAEAEPEFLSFDEPARSEDAPTSIQTLDEFQVEDDLWEAFQEEAREHFRILADELAVLETSGDPANLKTIRRSVHQLKGASGVVGMLATSKLNAAMQKVLDRVFEGEAAYTRELLPLFQSTFEVVLESVGGKGTGANLADRAKAVQAEYDRLLAVPPQKAERAPAPVETMPEAVDRLEAGADLWEAFHQEAEENLTAVGEVLRKMEKHAPTQDQVQVLRRCVHTFKGAAGVVGLRLTSAIAHRMEDVLDALYEGRLTWTADHAPLLFATYDVLTDAVTNRGIARDKRAGLQSLFAGYDHAMLQAHAQSAVKEEARLEPAAAPVELEEVASRKNAQFVRAPLEKVDDLVRLVSELVIHRSRFEQYLSGYVHEVSELQLSIERLSRISRRLQSDYEAAALNETNKRGFMTHGGKGPFGGNSSSDDFDALEFDRYTEFHLLSRDLAETTGDVSNAGSRLNELIADFDGYLNRLGTLTGEVEDRLMRLRMLPLRNLSSRLHRTVRVTADRRNKLVDLVVEGEAVELDKTVLEEMAGPIDHILRNAVDHGVETTEARRAAGKPERGAIHVRAFHEGTQVVLQIRDDGSGLDRERLRSAVVRHGYLPSEEAAKLSDQELFSFIFLPGFSTAIELSEVSGRGVGLDVVKSTVSRMKGTLSITSEPGKGTAFTIRLPMTLALTRVVLVRSGNETYAIPLAAIAQILRIEPEQLERVGRKPVLRLGGKIVPTIHLAEVAGQQLPPDANLTRLKAIVLNIGEQRLALMVDQVLEAREVVVKTLGTMLGRVHAVTGATIMGDGGVVLILNPNDMLHQQHTVTPQVRLRPSAPKPELETFEVLVVDDSPSVRRVVTNLIRNAGWTPHAAKDGLDALEMIHSGASRPDVVLLDIEMPRMDGFELTAALRSMPHFRNTPIVMLTSRAGEKHRKRAFELGASEYIIKPYQDEELLGVIRRTVRQARGILTR